MLYIKNPSLMLFCLYFLELIITKVFAIPDKNRYVVVHSTDLDLSKITNKKFNSLMHNEKQHFITMELTAAEAAYIEKELNCDGFMVLDDIIQLPYYSSTNITSVLQTSSDFLNDVPQCNANVDNVDFFVLDTVVYPDTMELSNVDLIYGPNYINDTVACNPHATWVSSIMVGRDYGVIPTGNRRLYNLAIFDCNGNGFPSYMIQAFSAVIEYSKINALSGRRAVVNLSGGGGPNKALDAAANAVNAAGIPIFVSAGNNNINACVSQSPAEASQVFTVAATQAPGNVPAYFTNWGYPGSCVRLYLPGVSITVASITDNGVTLQIAGTSFSTPIAAALGGIALAADPQATAVGVINSIVARTVSVTPPTNAVYNNLMPVMLASSACSGNTLLFNDYTTTKSSSNKFSKWYNGVSQDAFCVMFQASSVRNSALIGLRNNASDPASYNINIRIGVKYNSRKYINSIQQTRKTLTSAITANRILSKSPGNSIMVKVKNKTITVEYNNALGVTTPLLATAINHPQSIQEIAFSGSGAGVKYLNAMRC